MVRLSKGEVVGAWEEDLSGVLRRLRLDPTLDVAACVTLLLLVSMDVVLRFGMYEQYPFKCFELSRAYNEHWRVKCMDFLQVPDEHLDVGFSLRLKQLALAAGATEGEQLAYLMSESVQEALKTTFATAAVSSLPVERAFAETKRQEAPRLCSVATASRNQLLRHFHRDRENMVSRIEVTQCGLRQAMKKNAHSLAWERRADLVAPGIRAGSAPALDSGKAAELSAYVAANRKDLDEEVCAGRARAKAAAQRAKVTMPVTEAEWAAWIASRRDEFGTLMRSATSERRAVNERLVAASERPIPVPRLSPAVASQAQRPAASWVQLLWGRSGWYALQSRRGVVTLLLSHSRQHTWGLCVDDLAVRERVFRLESTCARNLRHRIRPLRELCACPVDGVWELCMAGAFAQGMVELQVARATPVLSPLPAAARKREARQAPAADCEDDVSAGSGDEVRAVAKDLKGVLDSDSDGGSVDTDMDSDLELDDFTRKEAALVKSRMADRLQELAARALDPAAPALAESPPASDLVTDAEEPRLPRAAVLSWTIWESLWFYITQDPKYSDVKIHMRGWLYSDSGGGMGREWAGKALTPHHFGETTASPTRTMILLRAWALQRARVRGWCVQRPGRQREAQRMSEGIIADVLAEHSGPPRVPLLHSKKAHTLLVRFVPKEVNVILQSN